MNDNQFDSPILPGTFTTLLLLETLELYVSEPAALATPLVIHDDAMSNLQHLQILNLRNMNIRVFPADIRTLSQLTSLDLSINSLTDIPIDAFFRLSNLITLSLFRNFFPSFMTRVFTNLQAVIYLSKYHHTWWEMGPVAPPRFTSI